MSEKLTTYEMATMLETIATDVNGAVASSLMKTLLSKNITIDDWNTFAKILADHSINDIVLQEFSKAVVEHLESLANEQGAQKNEITTLQTDVGILQTDVSTLQGNVSTLQGNVGTLQTDVDTLQTDMSGAKDEITILKDRMELAETDISVNAGDITRLYDSVDENTTGISDLKESKLDKTGGTVSGDLEVAGNLWVIGQTFESVLEKLNVRDAVIVTNAEGATLAVLSGFATRTGSDTTYGIMYDPASDSVKLGLVTVDENGVYRFADGEGSPVATRADSANMVDGNIVTWNKLYKRIQTTNIPAAVDAVPTEGSNNLITSGAVYSAIVQTLNTEV